MSGNNFKQNNIGLVQTKIAAEKPNDDDGSFINAGILPAVLNIGSMPFTEPWYHTMNDIPEKVDLQNVKMALQLILATVLYFDINGKGIFYE
ncbi:MAG: hypothetical protein SCK70_03100 [bacterium]|nr:hypothetical protein [bacterium]